MIHNVATCVTLLGSCLVGLLLCEGSLRLFYPKYAPLAEARARFDTMRIWAYTANSRAMTAHPDTGSMHALHHNNLALRQHRNFSATALTATNVGVFGDSFVENRGMDAPYSLTEPLDYLLNQRGRRFNVLNFGVAGYGTGQSLLHYEHFRYTEDLAYVFYVYCENDLRNITETALFHLDEARRLVRHEAIRSFWWVTRMNRLHLPYLILDATGRLSSYVEERARREGLKRERLLDAYNKRMAKVRNSANSNNGVENDEDFRERSAIFRRLIRRWKQLVEHNGGKFYAVLLPEHNPAASPRVPDLLQKENIETISLYDCFGTYDAEHYQRRWSDSPYRFKSKSDGHWNEAGNQLAALCLYRVLEEDMRLPALSEETLRATLHRYYAAFGGWMPVNTGGGGKGSARLSLSSTTAGIREKYQALTPILSHSGAFSVSLSDGFLLYHKEGCRPADLSARFFVHVFPVNETDLPEGRARHGYDTRNFSASSFQGGGDTCTVKTRLPDYAIRYIHTGQFVSVMENGAARTLNIWEADVVPPAFSAPAFSVSLSDGFLLYHKEGCRRADLSARFFVHVFPVNETDLPEGRARHRYDNRNFSASSFQGGGDSCTVKTRLPDYAIRHIHTGQFVGVVKNGVTHYSNLWETRIDPPLLTGSRT